MLPRKIAARFGPISSGPIFSPLGSMDCQNSFHGRIHHEYPCSAVNVLCMFAAGRRYEAAAVLI